MVVEEVEVPKAEESLKIESKEEIVEDQPKVSSEELLNKEDLTPSIPEAVIQDKPVVEEPVKTDLVAEKKPKQNSPVFWILIPGIFILGAILGGVVFYQKGVSSSKSASTPAPSAAATPVSTPVASPSANVDVSSFDVAVFNGSGTAGEAGKVKALLESAGFTVSSTGNAATYDYTKTIIKAKSSVDASVIQKVKDALSGSYAIGDSQTLTSSATADIQVVVGSSKAE
jgi:hypothetical protein